MLIYLVIGWKTETLTPMKWGLNASRPWKGRFLEGVGTRGGNERRRRQGTIHAVVGADISAAQHHMEEKSEISGP